MAALTTAFKNFAVIFGFTKGQEVIRKIFTSERHSTR